MKTLCRSSVRSFTLFGFGSFLAASLGSSGCGGDASGTSQDDQDAGSLGAGGAATDSGSGGGAGGLSGSDAGGDAATDARAADAHRDAAAASDVDAAGAVAACQGDPPASALITDFSEATASDTGYRLGIGGTYSYAAPGLTAPALSITGSAAKALSVSVHPGPPTDASNTWLGFGIYFDACTDASAYTGLRFTVGGDLGTCTVRVAAQFSEDVKTSDSQYGACTAASCYSPSAAVDTGANTALFATMSGGSPVHTVDRAALTGVEFQITDVTGADGGGCTGDFTLSDVSFYKPETGGEAGAATVTVSAAARTPRTGTWGVNYWAWAPTWGNDIAGTETAIAALAPTYMRIGGYNNDANSPDPFDHAELDQAVAYARAIGAEPILQVPLIADNDGNVPTAQTAADMVSYANLTQGYALKYVSVGNEPDIYSDQGSLVDSTQPVFPNYQPTDYCTSARAYVSAMKAVDPNLKIVGPDLSWKYVTGHDWLTQILQDCGDLFDVIALHRYPFSSAKATVANAAADATSLKTFATSIRKLMQKAGYGDKPLALTEMNLAYDAISTPLSASSGTVPHGLWVAETIAQGMSLGFWTTAIWSISDPDDWSLGIIGLPPDHTPRPAYYGMQLATRYLGPILLDARASDAGLRAFASRNASDTATYVLLINWNEDTEVVTIGVSDAGARAEAGAGEASDEAGVTAEAGGPLEAGVDAGARDAGASARVTVSVGGQTVSAVEIPDNGTPSAWTYGATQFGWGQGPVSLPVGQ